MSRPLLLLRPQPGNDESAARARALGIAVIQRPLFEIMPLTADALPDGPFDALLVTSANGVRHGSDVVRRFIDLPIFTVGEATADAIRALGGHHVQVGGGDAATTIPLIVAAGHRRLLHLCGADVRPFDPLGLAITRHSVYRSAALDSPPLTDLPPAVIAVHSPRAGERLDALIPAGRGDHILIAISRAAADLAGPGWAQVQVAPAPDDTALLRLASALCKNAS
ncbi:MAG TPA: uroporphyrinogen-III synthase [Sphingobium sp.]|nr:uroporphyrinogen-III synthase [Sphingobium sp.]